VEWNNQRQPVSYNLEGTSSSISRLKRDRSIILALAAPVGTSNIWVYLTIDLSLIRFPYICVYLTIDLSLIRFLFNYRPVPDPVSLDSIAMEIALLTELDPAPQKDRSELIHSAVLLTTTDRSDSLPEI